MDWKDIVIFLLVPVLGQVYKILGERWGYELGKAAVTVLIFASAVVMEIVFSGFSLPACSWDAVGECVVAVLDKITLLVGAAMIFYNVLLDRVFKGVKFVPLKSRG